MRTQQALLDFRSRSIRLLRRSLSRYSIEIGRSTARNGPELPITELLIDHFVKVFGNASVIQIGANDGLHDDPLHESLVRHKLPALLVEPLPDMCEALRRVYRDHTNVTIVNYAISTSPGTMKLYRVNRDAQVPDWAHGLASSDLDVILKHQSWDGLVEIDLKKHIEVQTVPVMTIKELLDENPGFRNPMFLQIDTEGHDYKVLESAITGGCLPPIVRYEHKHLSFNDQVSARTRLTSLGYSFLGGPVDTTAVRWLHGAFDYSTD